MTLTFISLLQNHTCCAQKPHAALTNSGHQPAAAAMLAGQCPGGQRVTSSWVTHLAHGSSPGCELLIQHAAAWPLAAIYQSEQQRYCVGLLVPSLS